MMVDDLFWLAQAGFEGNSLRLCWRLGGTGTGIDPSVAGNSAIRLNVIATQVLPSNGTRNR
jgi:hypothetical protein